MSKVLRADQSSSIDSLAIKYQAGLRRLLFQLATGGGKTVTFAGLINRFLKAPAFRGKKIVIAVHREELLKQARRTLYEWYGIVAQPITAGVRFCDPAADVYVTMVETANNRLKKNPRFFGDAAMLIVDEAHLGSFSKLFDYFANSFIVGFTATPISASKKHPLKNIYEDIVCGIDIPDLINAGSLVGDITFGTRNGVDMTGVRLNSEGDYNKDEMSERFKATKHVQNCVDTYQKNADGTKAIVFNIKVDHSLLVTQAFIDAGYNCRHLDGDTPDDLRKEILSWFSNTPAAILCNVGILTTGFDDTTVQTVVVNRKTKSLPLWIQMTGRGSRACKKTEKKFFRIIDMGDNVRDHGYWSDARDWAEIFWNPGKPKDKLGVAPVKNCDDENCDCIIPAQCRVCPICGKVQDVAPVRYDSKVVEIELLKANVNVDAAIINAAAKGYKPYHALHTIKDEIVNSVDAHRITVNADVAYNLLSVYQGKVEEWCRINKTDFSQWHKDNSAKWFFDAMRKKFNWQPERLQLQLN